MDESGSIRVTDFRRQKEFVADLARSFNNFGPNGVQMGLITFSFDARVGIKLNQFSDKTGFMAAVINVRQRGKKIVVPVDKLLMYSLSLNCKYRSP